MLGEGGFKKPSRNCPLSTFIFKEIELAKTGSLVQPKSTFLSISPWQATWSTPQILTSSTMASATERLLFPYGQILQPSCLVLPFTAMIPGLRLCWRIVALLLAIGLADLMISLWYYLFHIRLEKYMNEVPCYEWGVSTICSKCFKICYNMI